MDILDNFDNRTELAPWQWEALVANTADPLDILIALEDTDTDLDPSTPIHEVLATAEAQLEDLECLTLADLFDDPETCQ